MAPRSWGSRAVATGMLSRRVDLYTFRHTLVRKGSTRPTATVAPNRLRALGRALDPTGTVFYNTYDGWIEGTPGSTLGSCTRQIVWRHGAPDRSMPSRCDPGTYF